MPNPKTEKNRETRRCIGEALLQLMKEKSLEEIRITDIVGMAHVSRMTYYKYYDHKIEVLSDYLDELVLDYERDVAAQADIGGFQEYDHILHSLRFFGEHYEFAEILLNANLYSVFIDAINRYMEKRAEEFRITKYELFYYGGALCNVYMKWIEGGRKETPEEIAQHIYHFLTRRKR